MTEPFALRQCPYVMFVKQYVTVLVMGILLSITSALYLLEHRLLTEIFPQKPAIHWPGKPHFQRWKQRTMEFFHFDADAGQAGTLEMFGRPQRAYLASAYDWGIAMPSGRIARICRYTYPGFTISFDNGLLLLIEVTGPTRTFPLP